MVKGGEVGTESSRHGTHQVSHPLRDLVWLGPSQRGLDCLNDDASTLTSVGEGHHRDQPWQELHEVGLARGLVEVSKASSVLGRRGGGRT